MKFSRVDLSKRVSVYSVFGLALLYTSSYFIPLLTPTGAYLLPSVHVIDLVVKPTLVSVACVGAVIYAISLGVRRWCSPLVATIGAVIGLSLLALIGMKGFMDAAGYDLESLVPRGRTLQMTMRYFKVFAGISVIVVIGLLGGKLSRITRLLSSIGFAFGVLGAVRLMTLMHVADANDPAHAVSSTQHISSLAGGSVLPRRVVWVIFDETDFYRAYRSDLVKELPNFARLARSAVFAEDARSPASATFYSIPSLLTGFPMAGAGIKLDSRGSAIMEGLDGKMMPFEEGTSLFGTLSANGFKSSVLGFYHPYCRLFALEKCDSFAWPEIGGFGDGLLSNVPNGVSARAFHFNYWDNIVTSMLRLLPEYLARDDSLTFIHFNFPHLPASYADKVMRLPPSSDPLVEYAHNLKFTDQVLGQITQELETESARHDLLLVISTDHWLRKRWYQADAAEASQPIPLIMWKVGDANGVVLSKPLSTVHTGAMILDFLQGTIDSQSEIANWWSHQPNFPTYIAPGS